MKVVLPKPINYTDDEFSKTLTLVTNTPVWDPKLKVYFLDFNGRVTMPSINNFQLLLSIRQ
jgi:hypothetical protein